MWLLLWVWENAVAPACGLALMALEYGAAVLDDLFDDDDPGGNRPATA